MAGSRFVAALVIALAAFASTAGAEVDTVEARMAAAREYFAVSDLDGVYRQSVVEMAASLPAEMQDGYIRFMWSALDGLDLENIAATTMVEVFTLEEIVALTAFHTSDIGQSIDRKLPGFTGALAQAIQADIAEATQRYLTGQ